MIKKFLLGAVLSACAILPLVACDLSSAPPEPPPHEHVYDIHETVEPTCEVMGYDLHACTCGDFYVDNEQPKLGHIFTAYVSDGNATCKADGTKTAVCDRDNCDETDVQIDVGTKLSHVYKKTEVPAQGDQKGYILYECDCGDSYTEALRIASEGLVYTSYNNGTCYVSSVGTCGDVEVVIPEVSPQGDTVIAIGKNAFEGYELAQKVIFPKTLKSIGSDCFWKCHNLKSVELPDGLETISEWAFQETALTSIAIPESVTSLGKGVFYDCHELESANIPKNITSIPQQLFYKCYKLKTIVLSENVTSIAMQAFVNCYSLRTVTVNSKLSSIGYQTFCNCFALSEILDNGGNNFTLGTTDNGYIANYAIYIHTGESEIVNKDNFLYLTVSGVDYLIGYEGYIENLILPNTYNGRSYKIAPYAFYNNDDIKTVDISDGVTEICTQAFVGCDNIRFFEVPNSVTVLATSFLSGNNLVSVTLGSGLTSYGSFSGSKIVEIVNNSNLTITKGEGVASNVLTVHTGETVIQNVNGYLFYVNGYPATNYLLDYIGTDTDLVFPAFSSHNGTTYTVYSGAFQKHDGITSINMGNYVTRVESYAFAGISTLKSVVVGDNVEILVAGAFNGCKALETVTLGYYTKHLGHSIFADCKALKTVVWQAKTMNAMFEDIFRSCNDFTIEYAGTVQQWTAMTAYSTKFWKDQDRPESFVITVKCSDGVVKV